MLHNKYISDDRILIGTYTNFVYKLHKVGVDMLIVYRLMILRKFFLFTHYMKAHKILVLKHKISTAFLRIGVGRTSQKFKT